MAGTSVKSFFPQYFSFSIFTLTNVIIDSEVLFYIYTTGIPAHKFFHTFLGASLIAIFVALFCRSLCEVGLKFWNIILYTKKLSLFKVEVKITRLSAWCGAFVGAYSQLLLDSIMHTDMMPFFPFSNIISNARAASYECKNARTQLPSPCIVTFSMNSKRS